MPGTDVDLRAERSADLRVAIDVGRTRQEILGFGASDCWSIQYVGQWPLAPREAIADLLFETGVGADGSPRGIGLSIWRFNIGAASSRQDHISRRWRRADTFLDGDLSGHDWSRLPGQRWFLQAARERGVERLIAFVNSPPITMTKNGRAFCDPSSGSTNLAEGMEGSFARYLADIVAHFREAEAVEFAAISPFNEPQWDWERDTQEGCRYQPQDMLRVIDALSAEPSLAGTEIEIPESGTIDDLWSGPNYLSAFFDPGSPTNVSGKVASRVTGHSYHTDLPTTGLVDRREALRAALDRYPGIQYSMSEYCPLGDHGLGRDLGMDTALHVARVIHFDLVVAGASSWQWWLAASPYDYKDGLISVDQDDRGGEFAASKTLWALGNYSRFVRPGMIRLDVERSDGASHQETAEGVMVSAFLDDGRDIVAAVLINWTDRVVAVNLEIVGSRPAAWIPFVTSDAADLGACRALAPGEAAALPGRSIVTLVARAASAKMPRWRAPRRAVAG
jgi:O-glycosyl hydrolase